MKNKTILVRDALLVLPFLIFTIVWLTLKFGFDVDFAPGPNYAKSMYFNLIIPLAIIGIGQLLYAVICITDIVRSDQLETGKKIGCAVAVWFAVQYLYLPFYIFRTVVLLKKQQKNPAP